jgi:threonine-phosphate decarboxylase
LQIEEEMHRLNHTHGGNISEIARRYGLKPGDIIDFSASINPLGMSRKAERAIVNRLDAVLHYPEQFAESLIYEVGKFHDIPESCIMAGNGSTELIYLIPRVFKPKRALIVIPTFSEYRNALELIECAADTFLLSQDNGFNLEVDRLLTVLESKYDIIYICNPGNPTGTLIPKRDILGIADKASKYGTLCIVDEAFIDFVEDESVKKAVAERSNLIVLRSITKFFGIPGMRVGLVASCKENIGRMMAYKEPWSVNALGSIAAIESLNDHRYIEESRRYVIQERDNLFSGLKAIPWLKPYPSAANYILVRIQKDGLDADILFDYLAWKGILIRSCASFEGLDKRFFRVAVRKMEENERLIGTLRDLHA